VELILSLDSLFLLPAGAGYIEKSGQATVAVTRTESGVVASANCDSLTLLVNEFRTEIFHLNNEKTAIKAELKEQKILEVNRLTGWQSFLIWTGGICLALPVIITGIKIFKIIKI
jgi:hypothetical protein